MTWIETFSSSLNFALIFKAQWYKCTIKIFQLWLHEKQNFIPIILKLINCPNWRRINHSNSILNKYKCESKLYYIYIIKKPLAVRPRPSIYIVSLKGTISWSKSPQFSSIIFLQWKMGAKKKLLRDFMRYKLYVSLHFCWMRPHFSLK